MPTALQTYCLRRPAVGSGVPLSNDPYILFESSEGKVIDESLARRLIASQFPQWSSLPIRAVGLDGWDNRSCRLGSELTLRLPQRQLVCQTG
jgi:hypothetical protein